MIITLTRQVLTWIIALLVIEENKLISQIQTWIKRNHETEELFWEYLLPCSIMIRFKPHGTIMNNIVRIILKILQICSELDNNTEYSWNNEICTKLIEPDIIIFAKNDPHCPWTIVCTANQRYKIPTIIANLTFPWKQSKTTYFHSRVDKIVRFLEVDEW